MKSTNNLRLLPVIWLIAATCTDCTADNTPHTLPLPVVPAEIVEPQQRADYITLHFWDAMDFNNPKMALDTALVEQSIVDFLNLLPLTSTEDDAKDAVGVLIHKAEENEGAFRLVSSMAEKYLYETESPMLDEDRYKTFIEYYRQVKWVDEAENLRLDAKEHEISRCRPGTQAPDMELKCNGSTTPLSEIVAGKPSILMFYDNDCSLCQSTITEMTSDPRLRNVLANGKLSVVAIDLGEETGKEMPTLPNWTWATPYGDTEVDTIYSMRSTPSLYLIGTDGGILLKDVSYERLAQSIFH